MVSHLHLLHTTNIWHTPTYKSFSSINIHAFHLKCKPKFTNFFSALSILLNIVLTIKLKRGAGGNVVVWLCDSVSDEQLLFLHQVPSHQVKMKVDDKGPSRGLVPCGPPSAEAEKTVSVLLQRHDSGTCGQSVIRHYTDWWNRDWTGTAVVYYLR